MELALDLLSHRKKLKVKPKVVPQREELHEGILQILEFLSLRVSSSVSSVSHSFAYLFLSPLCITSDSLRPDLFAREKATQ